MMQVTSVDIEQTFSNWTDTVTQHQSLMIDEDFDDHVAVYSDGDIKGTWWNICHCGLWSSSELDLFELT